MATIPTLHLNGTGKTTLRDEYAAAYDALTKALEAFASTTSNARDFYPQGANAYQLHKQERNKALAELRSAKLYVEEMLAGIIDQI